MRFSRRGSWKRRLIMSYNRHDGEDYYNREKRDNQPPRKGWRWVIVVSLTLTIGIAIGVSISLIRPPVHTVLSTPSATPTQPPLGTTATSSPTLRPIGNFPSTSVDHVYGNCIGVEVEPHHDPTLGIDWNPDADYQVNRQP